MTRNPPVTQSAPPHSRRTEQTVLAALFLAGTRNKPGVFAEVSSILAPIDFYIPAHQTIYRHMLALHDQGAPVDDVSLCESLDADGRLKSCGGSDYLAELLRSGITCSDISYHARIVKDHAQRRAMAGRVSTLLEKVYQSNIPREDIQAQIHELADMGGPVAPSAPFRFLSLDEMTSEPQPIDWLIRNYLEAHSLAVLFGDPSCMKSFLAIDMGMSIATGKPWHGQNISNPGPVLYIAAEGFHGLKRRLRAWRVAYGVQNAPFYTATQGMQLPDQRSAMAVREAVAALEQPPRLIVVDTLSRTLVGDENSTKDMAAFVQALDALKHELQCAILIVHHSGLQDKTRSRGSSALLGGVDFEYRLSVQGEIRLLSPTKTKDHEKPPELAFEPEEIGTGWNDPETGEELTSCILRRTDAPEVSKPKPRLTGATRIAFEALVKCVNAKASGKECIDLNKAKIHLDEWREQANKDGITASTSEDAKRMAFKRAVPKLLDIGRIKASDDYYWISE